MKGVAIVSGGMDSITMMYYLKSKGWDLDILTFDYGSKHNKKEHSMIKYHLGKSKHIIIPLDFINKYFKSDLLQSGGDIPEGHYEDESMKATVVPFRNGIMLSIAVGYAESIGADHVFLGSHAGDHAIYPDCRKDFTDAISQAATLGTYNKTRIVSPFNSFSKGGIVRIGFDLGVDYSKTWSCYKGGEKHCGKCGTCVERLEAFKLAGHEDLVNYEEENKMGKVSEVKRLLALGKTDEEIATESGAKLSSVKSIKSRVKREQKV